MKKLMAFILMCVTFNAFALEKVEKQYVDRLMRGDYNISVSQQTDLNKLFSNGKDFISFEYSVGAEKFLSSRGIIGGVDFEGTHSSDNDVQSALHALDFRAGGAILLDGGDVAAFFGTVGLRSDVETREQGSVFQKGGALTTIENRLNIQVGARIAFYAKVVNGHMQIVLLPMIDEYELESQLAVDFREMNRTLVIADSIILKSKLNAGLDGESSEGFVRLLFSINMNWGIMYYAETQLNLDYGPEIIWDKSGNASFRFYIGVRASL